MSSIIAKRDRQAEAVGRYESLGRLPNGHTTWASFAVSMQREKESYFALSLMEAPPKTRSEFFFSPKDEVVFGVLTTRDDGRIGKLCFPVLSSKPGESDKIELLDGFGREDLGLELDPTDDWHLIMRESYKTHRRISKIHIIRSEVERLLEDRLERWIGWDEDVASFGHAEANRLLALRTMFEQVFPRQLRDTSCSKEIVVRLCRLDRLLQLYLDGMRKELPVKEAMVKSLKERIENFRLK